MSFKSVDVRELILQDRHVTYGEIETTLSVSGTSIHSTLHKYETVTKICSRWIPQNILIVQEKARIDWSKKIPKKIDRGASKHVYDIVTVEAWIYDIRR